MLRYECRGVDGEGGQSMWGMLCAHCLLDRSRGAGGMRGVVDRAPAGVRERVGTFGERGGDAM